MDSALGLLDEILSNENSGMVLGIVALAIAVATALINARQAKRAAQANESYAYLELRKRYHKERMRNQILLLSRFACPVKQANHEKWEELLDDGRYREIGELLLPSLMASPQQQELMQAVRDVASYFEDVGFLFKFEHVRGDDCKLSFINVGGLNVYYEICVPIYVARDPKNAVTLQYVAPLRKVLKRHGEGLRVY